MAPQQWRIQKDKSVLQVTNVTSLGKVTQKRFGAPFLLQWLIYRQHRHLSDSVPVTDGKWLVNKVWSISPLSPCLGGGGHLTRRLKTGTTRGENLSSSSPSLSYHAFWKKDNKHRQRYNHALTDPRKRDGSPERSLLSKCLIHLALAENRHFNMTSMFIRVSFSTLIHATTMQRGGSSFYSWEKLCHEVAWPDPKQIRAVANVKRNRTVVILGKLPALYVRKCLNLRKGAAEKRACMLGWTPPWINTITKLPPW